MQHEATLNEILGAFERLLKIAWALKGIKAITKIAETWNNITGNAVSLGAANTRIDLLFLVETLVNEGRYNPRLRKSVGKFLDALRARNEIKEQDMVFRYTLGLQHVNRHTSRAACPFCQHVLVSWTSLTYLSPASDPKAEPIGPPHPLAACHRTGGA